MTPGPCLQMIEQASQAPVEASAVPVLAPSLPHPGPLPVCSTAAVLPVSVIQLRAGSVEATLPVSARQSQACSKEATTALLLPAILLPVAGLPGPDLRVLQPVWLTEAAPPPVS